MGGSRYELHSTEGERKAADAIRRKEFEELRTQCAVLRDYIAKELKIKPNLEKGSASSSLGKGSAEAEVLAQSEVETSEKFIPTDGTRFCTPPDTPNKRKGGGDVFLRAHDKATLQSMPPKINPKVDCFLQTRGRKALEDARDWMKIIRLDAVRMSAEWVPYSTVLNHPAAKVTDKEADRRAHEVGIREHSDHLEPSLTHHAARVVAILEAYALYDPETGYCQGMSDLLSPFVALMDSDSQAFWCFARFMETAKENFRTDEAGIRRQLQLVGRIFKISDPQFHKHLVEIQAEDCFFAYRMIVVLLRRELTFEQTLCLWEVIWADWATLRFIEGTTKGLNDRAKSTGKKTNGKSSTFHLASKDLLLFTIAAAVLQQRKHIIERCRGVDEILSECNAMAGKLDVWELMDSARVILQDFQEKISTEKSE